MPDLQSRELYRSALVSIHDVRCRGHDARGGDDERASAHELVFVRRGVFVKHVAGRQVVAEPARALFFNAGEEYRVSHPVPGGDDCTAFAFPADTIGEVLAHYRPAAPRSAPAAPPFTLAHALLEPRVLLRQQRLRAGLRAGTVSALEADEAALALLSDVVHDAYQARGVRPHRARVRRAETLRRRRAAAEQTKLRLAGDPAANVSLTDLARAVGRSPFHLARLFAAEVGLPIHQYHLRLRLALALERLADGAPSLSRLAVDLGFASHSHFTSLFARTFGLSPSAFRRSASHARLRELRKAATA